MVFYTDQSGKEQFYNPRWPTARIIIKVSMGLLSHGLLSQLWYNSLMLALLLIARRLWPLALMFLLAAATHTAVAQLQSDQIAILVNTNRPDSKIIADHYCLKRSVPTSHIIAFSMNTSEIRGPAERTGSAVFVRRATALAQGRIHQHGQLHSATQRCQRNQCEHLLP